MSEYDIWIIYRTIRKVMVVCNIYNMYSIYVNFKRSPLIIKFHLVIKDDLRKA